MKPVKDFEDYKVTKDGEVFDKNGRKLTVGRDNQGYATVTLRKDGKSYTRRLHRVVGETYLKPIEGKNIINHKDGDKSHCRLINLEYMSNSENTKHGYDNGFYRSRSKLPVIVIDKDGIESEFTSIRGLSRELGLNRKTVSSILNSGRKNNYDYTFKYKEASGMYRDYIEKLAKEKKKDSKAKAKAIGGTGAIGGGVALSAISGKKNADKILGYEKVYHGSTKEQADRIKREGIKPGVKDNKKEYPVWMKREEDKIHLSKYKDTAKAYARDSEIYKHKDHKANNRLNALEDRFFTRKVNGRGGNSQENLLFTSELDGTLSKDQAKDILRYRDRLMNQDVKSYDKAVKKAKKNGNGKVTEVNIGYNKWKKDYRANPNRIIFKSINGEDVDWNNIKKLSAIGKSKIDPEEIVGSSIKNADKLKYRLKNLPSYVKENPKRFAKGVAPVGAGVALAGLGTGLIASAMKNADIKRKEK